MKQKTYRIIYFRGDNLAKHEFGIIDSFEENKWYSDYEPEKYNCISVRDDLIEQLIINYDEELKSIIRANNRYQSQELEALIEVISDAIKEDKYLIHYGI